MGRTHFTFDSDDGTKIYVNVWAPEEPARGIVQISHGMVEHSERYDRFAQDLNKHGFKVYANDHRGHGRTAGSVEKVGYLADSDGFEWLVKDMGKLTDIIRKENPDLPVFLFGHSMGSFASQRYIQLYADKIRGVILSGSNGNSLLFPLGRHFAKGEVRKQGPHGRSEKMNKMSFGSYNNAFKPARTDFDWLSRDEQEVDKYIADPYCGAVCASEFYYDFMDGLVTLFRPENVAKVPTGLPILIVSGSMDPVGNAGRGVVKLKKMYEKHGVKDLQMKLYEGARHEILNETNRDEVMGDIEEWLERHMPEKEAGHAGV